MHMIGHDDPRTPLVQAVFIFSLVKRPGHQSRHAPILQPERTVRGHVRKAVGLCEGFARIGEGTPRLTQAPERAEQPPGQEQNSFRRIAVRGASLVIRHRDVQAEGLVHQEVVIFCDNVMDGYYKDLKGASAVINGPWFHSGDLAVWDHEGYIRIVDHSDSAPKVLHPVL